MRSIARQDQGLRLLMLVLICAVYRCQLSLSLEMCWVIVVCSCCALCVKEGANT